MTVSLSTGDKTMQRLKKRLALLFALSIGLLAVGSASAGSVKKIESLPFEYKVSHKLDEHQIVTTHVKISALGKFATSVRYSNAKTIDGDHFAVSIVVRAPGRSTALLNARHSRGVDPAFWGKTNVEWTHAAGHIDNAEEVIGGTVEVNSRHNDRYDDKEFWEVALTVLRAILKDEPKSHSQVGQGLGPDFMDRF